MTNQSHMAHHHIMRSGNCNPGSALKMSAKSANIDKEELAYVDFVQTLGHWSPQP